LELLVASILAVILIGLLGNMLRSALMQQRELELRSSASRQTAPLAALRDQLRRDFASAAQIDPQPRALQLVGYAGHERRTGAATLQPARVSYQIAVIGERSWLIRRESPLKPQVGRAAQTELVWPDVAAIQYQQVAGERLDADGKRMPSEAPRFPLVPGLVAAPRALRIELITTSGEVLLSELLLRQPDLP